MPKVIDRLKAAPPEEVLRRDRRIATLEGSLRESQASYRHAMDALHQAEEKIAFVDTFRGEARDPAAWERDSKKSGKHYSAIVAASDWHVGEVVDPKAVGGLNTFDRATAYNRARRFFTKIPEYVERYAPAAKTIYIWAGGDFISGYIHEELMESNSMSPTEECLFFADVWTSGLKTLLKEMPGRRLVIPTSWGNHGRTTPKSRVSTAAANSFEQLMYCMLAHEWRDERRIAWKISSGYHNVLDIHGRKVRFHHGDGMKFWGGVGGLTIPVRKAIAQWNRSERVDLDVFGHYHEYIDGGHFVGNGSLVGYGPFSVQIKADYQPPIQAFLVFDAKFGLRQSTRIFVGD